MTTRMTNKLGHSKRDMAEKYQLSQLQAILFYLYERHVAVSAQQIGLPNRQIAEFSKHSSFGMPEEAYRH